MGGILHAAVYTNQPPTYLPRSTDVKNSGSRTASKEGRGNVEVPVWRHWEEVQGDHGKEEAGVVTS